MDHVAWPTCRKLKPNAAWRLILFQPRQRGFATRRAAGERSVPSPPPRLADFYGCGKAAVLPHLFFRVAPPKNAILRGDGTMSAPSCQNRFRLHDLFRRSGEAVSEFSGPVDDMDLDGVQAAVLHPQAELFVDFLDAVLLQAIAHASASARDGLMAMLNAGYFGRRRMFKQRIQASRGGAFARCAGETVSPGFCGRRDRRGRMITVF
jgi:hypothetical protein